MYNKHTQHFIRKDTDEQGNNTKELVYETTRTLKFNILGFEFGALLNLSPYREQYLLIFAGEREFTPWID